VQNDTADHGIERGVYYTTAANGAVYAFVMAWPEAPTLTLTQPKPLPAAAISMLGVEGVAIKWTKAAGGGIVVEMPTLRPNQLPSFTGPWVLKLTGVQ